MQQKLKADNILLAFQNLQEDNLKKNQNGSLHSQSFHFQNSLTLILNPCADPETFVRRSPTLTFFLVDERRDDPNTTKSGPSSACQ